MNDEHIFDGGDTWREERPWPPREDCDDAPTVEELMAMFKWE